MGGKIAMFLTGHMQNAYVTHDIEKAMEIVGNRFDVQHFDRHEPDMVVNTVHGHQQLVCRVATYWEGGLNIEIIQPVSGFVPENRTTTTTATPTQTAITAARVT